MHRLWIRTPLIPGATDSDANLAAIGRHLADRLDGTVFRWELCAFNNLCRDQYTRLGLQWDYAATPLMTPAELAHCEHDCKGFRLACGACACHRRHPRWMLNPNRSTNMTAHTYPEYFFRRARHLFRADIQAPGPN